MHQISVMLIILIMAISHVTGISHATEQPVRLAGFAYAPFFRDTGRLVDGIAVDIAHELFTRLGLTTELEIYPLKRALLHLKNGDRDALLLLIKTPERQAYLIYSRPVMTIRGLIWSRADLAGGPVESDRLTELGHHRIGITRGYSYGPQLDALFKTMPRLEENNTNLENFRLLQQRQIDIFPCNELVARALFKTHPDLRDQFIPSRRSFLNWELHLVISKKSPLASRVDEINAVIEDLEREGFIERTVEKYTH